MWVVILLVIAGIGYGIYYMIEAPYQQKMKEQMGEEKYKKWRQESLQKGLQKEEAKKYNNFSIECPMCHSKYVRSIGNLERSASVSMLGLASSKIGKQYECTNCHHKF